MTRYVLIVSFLAFFGGAWAQADLAMQLTSSVDSFQLYTNVTFTASVTNTGPSAASGVVVSFPIPVGFAYTSSTTAAGSFDIFNQFWNVGSIPSGQTMTLQLVLFTLQNNNLTAFAQVQVASPSDPDSQPGNNSTTTPAQDDEVAKTISPLGGPTGGGGGGNGSTDADLSLDISTSATGYNVGTVEPFIIKVSNAGPGDGTGVKIKTHLPTNLTVESYTSPTGTYDVNTGIWNVGTVPANGDRTLILNCQATVGGLTTMFAQVQDDTSNDPDSTPGNDTNQTANEDDEDSHTVEALQVDMELNMSLAAGSTASIELNGQVTFEIAVTNYGPSMGENTKVRCILPVGLQFVSASATLGDYNSALGVWIVGNFPANTTQTLTLTAQGVSTGNKTYTCEVRTVNQPDVDSTPSNFMAGEDDQDEITINVGGGGGSTDADLQLTATTSTPSPLPGTTASVQFQVQNGGPATASGVTVKFNLPASGVNFATITPSVGTYSSSTQTWTVGTLAAAGSATISFSGSISAASGTTLTTFGQVETSGAPDPDSAPGNDTNQTANEDDEAAVSINVGAVQVKKCDLALGMTASPTTFTATDTITYILTLTNSGDTSAHDVTVKDVLPSALTFVSATPSGAYNSSSGIWTVGTVNIGTPVSLILKVKPSGTAAITDFAQVQTASPADLDSSPGNDTNNTNNEDDEALVSVSPQPVGAGPADLSISLTSSSNAPSQWTNTTISVSVTNAGPNPASNVTVKYLLPSGMAFSGQTVPAGTTYNSWNGIWSIPSLASGETKTLQITEFVLQLSTSHFAQVMSSGNSDPDSAPGNDTNNTANEDDEAALALPNVAPQPKKVDLALTMTANSANFTTGQNITFTLTCTNTGDTTAHGTTVTVNLPAGFTFVSANPPADYTVATGIWNIGTLAVGASETLTLVATATATSGNLATFAQVQAATPADTDSTPGNDTDNTANEDDEAKVTLPFFDNTPKVDLALTMTGSINNYTTGQTITYTLTCTNTGTAAANGVTVTDVLPAGLTFVSANPSADYTLATGIWNIGSLAIGASETLTITATVTATSGTIVNFAQVTTASPTDLDSAPNNNTGTTPAEDDEAAKSISPVPVTPITDLELNLTANNQSPSQWTHVIMTLTCANTSTVNATNVTVAYPIPTGLAYSSSSTAAGTYSSWNGSWNIGNLNAGQTATLTVDLFVNQITSSHFAQVITASPQDADSTPGNDTNQTDNEDDEVGLSLPNLGPQPKRPDLALAMTASATSFADDDAIDFTLTVNNTGDTTAHDVTVKDLLPAAFTYVGASNAAAYNDGIGIWTIGNIAAGGSATITLNTTAASATAAVTNFAQVQTATPNDPDSTPGNDTNQSTNEDDEAAVTLLPIGAGNTVDLSLALTTAQGTYRQWTNTTFTCNVTNQGFVNATDVAVAFPFPAGMVFTSKTEGAGTYDLNTKVWNIGNLNVGQTATLQLVLFHLSNAPTVTAFAQVQTASPTDGDSAPGNNNGTTPAEDDEAAVSVGLAANLIADDGMNVPIYIDNIFPNPAFDWVNVHLRSHIDIETNLVLYNTLGQAMRYVPISVIDGESDHWFELNDLPSGWYYIMIEGQSQRIPTGKFWKE